MRTRFLWMLAVVMAVSAAVPTLAHAQTDSQHERALAQARDDIARAKRDLKVLQRRYGEAIPSQGAHIAGAILDMYKAARKYNELEQAIRRGEKTHAQAVVEFEEFSGIHTGETSLEGAVCIAIRELKRGQLRAYDAIDRRVEEVLQRHSEARRRLQMLESGTETAVEAADTQPDARPLGVSASPATQDIPAGEIAEVTFNIVGSSPPYIFRTASLTGEHTGERLLEGRTPLTLPFTFGTPGVRTVYVTIEDTRTPRQYAQVTLTFHVTAAPDDSDTSDTTPPAAGVPARTPHATPPVSVPGGSGTAAFIPVPAGTYDAYFWYDGQCFGTDRMRCVAKDGSKWPDRQVPIPMTVTVTADGRVTAEADYECPLGELDHPGITFEARLRLSGTTDMTNGKTDLLLTEGQIHWRKKEKARSGTFEESFELDYSFTAQLGGRMFYDAYRNALITETNSFPFPQSDSDMQSPNLQRFPTWPAGDVARYAGKHRPFPMVMSDPGGLRRLRDSEVGWYGYTTGFSVVNHVYTWTHPQQPGGHKTDETAEYQKRAAGTSPNNPRRFWYLKILGLRTTAVPQAASTSPPASSEGELLAFGLWPLDRVLPVRPGGAVKLEAVGVTSENIFDVKTFNDRATWTVPPGFTGRNGSFRAPSSPGVYEIVVERPGWNGRPMRGSIQVRVR